MSRATLNKSEWSSVADTLIHAWEPANVLTLTDYYISDRLGQLVYRCGADWCNGAWLVDSDGEPGDLGAWEIVLTPGDSFDEAYVVCRREWCRDGGAVVSDLRVFARPGAARRWVRAGCPLT